MKTLIVMRHGKSTWKDKDMEDHERPLKKRGVKNSARMGELLKDEKLVPERILSSTAVRARQTVEAVTSKMNFKGEVQYLDKFYLGEMETILAELCELPDEVNKAMVIGHNPGLESLVQILGRKVEALTTSSVAYIKLPIKHWKELSDKTEGDLKELWHPKE